MIHGLTYLSNAIDIMVAQTLLHDIDTEEWRTDLKRRVQHYGYIYDYKRHTVDQSMYLGKLPEWSPKIVKMLELNPAFGIQPDQMIVNEYQPGQGIAHHIDCEPCFGDRIASISLNSSCLMTFIHVESNQTFELMLEPNSLLIMRDEARYNWKHGISARKSDIYQGKKIKRGRRISVTFRKVILNT